tara:strand:- start:3332 stop:3739 length:408 start_codon:yes stop_codon:yes gene_type:complete
MDTINKIKELLGMELDEPKVETKEVELQEEAKEVEVKEEVVEPKYATQAELADMKNEFMRMFKALLDETKKDVQEVPQELSSDKKEEVKEEVELSEVEEIVHSPENEVEKKEVKFSKPLEAMTPQERIFAMLNNK